MDKTQQNFEGIADVSPLVTFKIDFKRLNICVENSYLVINPKKIKECVNYIVNTPSFQLLRDVGFTRTAQSMCHEWIAHNYLFYRNYEPERTKSVDLNQKETTFKKLCYWILSLLYGNPEQNIK